MLPSWFQVLTFGAFMLVAYTVLLAWLVGFGVHLVKPALHRSTIRLLWPLCLLMFGCALIQGNWSEMQVNRQLLAVSGGMDPVQYSQICYLSLASSLVLAGCGMVLTMLTGWASFLPPARLPG